MALFIGFDSTSALDRLSMLVRPESLSFRELRLRRRLSRSRLSLRSRCERPYKIKQMNKLGQSFTKLQAKRKKRNQYELYTTLLRRGERERRRYRSRERDGDRLRLRDRE